MEKDHQPMKSVAASAPSVSDPVAAEPLVRESDGVAYQEGYARYRAGEWDDDHWTGFRVRFGVYGQRQEGVQMVRLKVPAGSLTPAQLRVIAAANRRFAQGHAHVTTRQDFQIYHVPLDKTPELLAFLYARGVSTREACGNTIRNINACALAGVCPHERIDAAALGRQLSLSWIRHPLTQNMPRKFKIALSGCAADCGATTIHDFGLIPTVRDGQNGFRVVGGGGLGSAPRPAATFAEFVTEAEVPAALEAVLRLHQRYSDRINRNAARLKFVLSRFGEEKFQALFAEEFARLKPLPQRPWTPLVWREPDADAAPVAAAPHGLVPQHDGRVMVIAAPELGNLSTAQLEALADLAEAFGVAELRLTRDQNIALVGVAAADAATVAQRLRQLGLPVPESAAEVRDLIACPGTTTCRIGITNAPSFGQAVLAQSGSREAAQGISVRISGCHNSCGLHHIGDFGFHGMAKKLDGQAAPHYQIHFGGDGRRVDGIGLGGPIIPARQGPQALMQLQDAYARERQPGESVRGWVERIGKTAVLAHLSSLNETHPEEGTVFIDWGDAVPFAGAPKVRGECAAPVIADAPLADLADDALILMDRAVLAGDERLAREAGDEAVAWAARRLLSRRGTGLEDATPADQIVELARAVWADQADALARMDTALRARSQESVPAQREAVAIWLDTVRSLVAAPDATPDTATLEAQFAGL